MVNTEFERESSHLDHRVSWRDVGRAWFICILGLLALLALVMI